MTDKIYRTVQKEAREIFLGKSVGKQMSVQLLLATLGAALSH
jgi:hypothetical protein